VHYRQMRAASGSRIPHPTVARGQVSVCKVLVDRGPHARAIQDLSGCGGRQRHRAQRKQPRIISAKARVSTHRAQQPPATSCTNLLGMKFQYAG